MCVCMFVCVRGSTCAGVFVRMTIHGELENNPGFHSSAGVYLVFSQGLSVTWVLMTGLHHFSMAHLFDLF